MENQVDSHGKATKSSWEAGEISEIQVDQGPLPTATVGYMRQGVSSEAAELFHGRYLLGHELKVTVKALEAPEARKVDDDFWRHEPLA